MKPAFAAIPDSYINLANDHNGWFYFVSLIAVVIRGMQMVERFILQTFVAVVGWPLAQLIKALRDRDGMLIEHSSATSAGLMAVWACLGREPDEAYRVVMSIFPYGLLLVLAAGLCVAQFASASRGTLASRGTALVCACVYWSFLSGLLLAKTGFLLFHVLSAPLAFLCGLCAWLLWEKTDGPTNKSTTAQ